MVQQTTSKWDTSTKWATSTNWDTSQKTHLNLLEIQEIGPVHISESKQQNYDQISHM